MRELGLHPDAFFGARVAILDRRAFAAVTAKLMDADGWHVRERALICTLVTTDEGDDVLIGVVPWQPREGDPPITRESLYSEEARERREQRFLAAVGPVLLLYPSVHPRSVIFCVAGLAPQARERALVKLGISEIHARELVGEWDETGDS